jgi:Domain of unknown function (DUF4440)
MKHAVKNAALCIFASLLVVCAFLVYVVRAAESSQAEAEKYIKLSESQWAEAVATHDATVPERILAADFVGIAPDGSHYSKADDIAENKAPQSEFKSNRLVDVKVRFYGDAAVAQGSEAWEKRSGERGRYVWTDTWIRRNGKWQVVAAEDVAIPETKK